MKILRNLALVASIVVLAFGSGVQFGRTKTGTDIFISSENVSGKSGKTTSVDFSIFWDVWERLGRYYIDKSALDPAKMVYGAVSGMVNSLEDPYTVFLPPQQNFEAKQDLGGKFEGIGAQLGIKDKHIVVVAPLKGTPAEKAGLKPGDWIVKVDGKETADWTLPETVSKIRGPKGSTVLLTILSKDATATAEVKVERQEIKVASVEWEIKNVKCTNTQNGENSANFKQSQLSCETFKDLCPECKRIVYVKLGRFGDETTDEWSKAVNNIVSSTEYINNSLKGLVFDLRNNPGGYLKSSVVVASEFLKDGNIAIQENAGGSKQMFNAGKDGRLTKIPMVVLINKGSASASEIVAGALKVRGRARLVGEKTFGKGSIQEAQELASGAGIHITTAKWLLPDESWINGEGITPDITVENDPEKPDLDAQLLKAYEEIVK